MDLEGQAAIKDTVEKYNHSDSLLVVLGSPNAESAEIYAETVTIGDPTYVGVLAGVALKLPVYHILEPEIKDLIEPEIYESQVGVMSDVLDVEDICKAMRGIREKALE